MCRYSDKVYKMRFACLDCHLSFKESHVPKSPIGSARGTWGKECPSCKQPMKEMGRDFKPPKKTDDKAWLFLKESGITFFSCGC